jgi:hypothetical protein
LLLTVLAVCSSLAAASATAWAETVIDTTSAWDGSSTVCAFGRPNTATYGQVVTVPSQDPVLDSFTFYINDFTGSGTTVVFRGEVYAWDGTKATGPNLWEGAPRTLPLLGTPQEVTFNTGGVQLNAGQQYVIFASVSKDYEQNADPSLGCWGYLNASVYNGGGFVFLNNGGDESQWTTIPWDTFFGNGVDDLAFKASFSRPLPTSKDECKKGGWRTFGVFKNQGDCVSFVATRGKNQPAQTPPH